MNKLNRNIPLTLMQNLFYPASFGAALVLLIFKIIQSPFSEILSDLIIYGFAMLLLLYFSLSYLMNERESIDYNWSNFLFDFIELTIIIIAFNNLGFSGIKESVPNFRCFYIAIMFVPILHFFWSREIGNIRKELLAIYFSRIIICIFGALLNNSIFIFDIFALMAFWGLTIWYISMKII